MGRYCTVILPERAGTLFQCESLAPEEHFSVYVTRPQKACGSWSGDSPAPGFATVVALYFPPAAPITARPELVDVILAGRSTPTRYAWAWIHSAANIAPLPHATQAGRIAA